MCTRVGVLDRGRLVLQDQLDDLRAPTGRTVVRTPDGDAARALLDGRVDAATATGSGARRRPGGAERPAGRRRLPVDELAPERRSLEEVVLGPPSRAGTAVIGVELRKLVREPAHLGDDPAARPAAHPGRHAAGRHRPRPAARAPGRPSCRPCSPTARCSRWRRWRSCCRSSSRSRSRSSPATRSPGEAQSGTLRYLLSGRSAAPGLLVAKLGGVVVFVVLTVLVVAATAFVVGALLLGGERVTQPAPTSVSGRAAHQETRRCGSSSRWPTRCCRCSGSPRSRSCSRRSPTPRCRPRSAPRLPHRVVAAADPRRRARRCSPTCRRATGSPSSTSSATRSCGATSARGAAPSGLRGGVPGCRLGQLHHEGHHRLADRARRHGRHGASRAPSLGHRDDRRCRGRPPWPTARSGQTLWTARSTAPSSDADSGGTTVLSSSVQIATQTRPGRGLVAGVERGSRSLSVAQLPAGRGAGSVPRPPAAAATSVPWCGEPSVMTRRARAAPPWSRTQSPGHHSAGGVADHVDRGRWSVAATPRRGRAQRLWRRSPLPSPAGSRRAHVPAVGTQGLGEHGEARRGPAVPRHEQHGTGLIPAPPGRRGRSASRRRRRPPRRRRQRRDRSARGRAAVAPGRAGRARSPRADE